jgi:hypothetical protein
VKYQVCVVEKGVEERKKKKSKINKSETKEIRSNEGEGTSCEMWA